MGHAVTAEELAHFETHGFCVVRNVITPAEAEAGRAMMDELFTQAADCDIGGRPFQLRPWPPLSAAENGGPTRSGDVTKVANVEHPIHDERAAIGVLACAAAVAPVLRSRAPTAQAPEGSLRLIHQNWRRTLPTPPPEQGYPPYLEPRLLNADRAGLHMDSAFLPRHYETSPRGSYVLVLLALSPVVSGGAPFLVGPGSYATARVASAALSPEYQASVNAKGCYQELRMNMMEQVNAAKGHAMEIPMEVGSLLIFDPMLSHQGSPFREGTTHAAGVGRYCSFQVWADDAAIGDSLAGVPARPYSSPATKYTKTMTNALPRWAHSLFHWELPFYDESKPGLRKAEDLNVNARL